MHHEAIEGVEYVGTPLDDVGAAQVTARGEQDDAVEKVVFYISARLLGYAIPCHLAF